MAGAEVLRIELVIIEELDRLLMVTGLSNELDEFATPHEWE